MTEPATIILAAGKAEIQAAAGGEGARLPRVVIVAYGGGLMKPAGWPPLVVDLAGLKMAAQVPLLADHDSKLSGIVGQARPKIERGQVLAEGHLVPTNEAAQKIIDLARGGFEFSASVGIQPERIEQIGPGKSVTVNGRTITAANDGGFLVTRAGVLREITICAIGADAQAAVAIAASLREGAMNFEQWLQANGFDPATITDQQRTTLEASWKAHHPAGGGNGVADAGELQRAAIQRIQLRWDAAQWYEPQCEQRARQAYVEAMAGLITPEQFEQRLNAALVSDRDLHLLHSRYAGGPNMRGDRRGHGVETPKVLEAAVLRHMGYESLAEKELGAAAIQAAADLRCHHFLDIFRAGLQLAGRDVPADRNDMIRASFSTLSVSGILGNAANKLLLSAYRAFPSVARLVAKKLSANDFKTHTGYRLTGDSKFEEVGDAGEIKHGTLGESSYTYKISTFARMFGITRQQMINDDLGAFDELPRLIGRGCAVTIEEEFWKFVMANSGTFFGSGNLNYISGADSALAIIGLGRAVQKMREFVDAQGDPIMVEPVHLVVPPALEVTADQLYTSSNLLVVPDAAAAETTTQPDGNPFRGKYQPRVVPHLGNSGYTGYSATAWYLFGNPADVAAFGLAYLDGRESPHVESQDADFSTLGLQYRGYVDFGITQVDCKGAVKSAGQ